MKYMKLFDQHSEYETYISSETADLPNVSWCIDERESHINPKDYSKEYLTFNILSGGTINWKTNNTGATRTISYSKDSGETWTDITSSTAGTSFNVSAGETVMFKGSNSAYATSWTISNSFSGGTAYFDIEGNIMSLIAGDGFATATTLSASYTFVGLFGYAKIVHARHLILPATTLADNCYWNMFLNCTSLTTAPELPATTLAVSCYAGMFYGCTSLTATPELPATTLAVSCYHSMFQGCTSLTSAPELPATTLGSACYQYMFRGCTSLTSAPELPATTLDTACYSNMFQNCTSLRTAPELPATTLASSCYYSMFQGCTSLVIAPELPATTLAASCYYGMFQGCTNLTTAPELPATTLATSCYNSMFFGCSNLNSITCLAVDISATDCTTDWVSGVAASGTFTKPDEMTSWTIGTSGIPNGWEINNYYETQPLTLKTDSGNEGVFTLKKAPYKEILYSIDNGLTWVSTTSTSTTLTASTVLLKSTDLAVWDDYNYDASEGIDCSVNFHVQGNIMSLLYGDNYIGHNTVTVPYAFYDLFINSKLTSASNLCMPATTLASNCYEFMFYGCTSLTTAPELPATTLANYCYQSMFYGCTSLTTAPELPATTLTNYCYTQMFFNCTSLTTAPELSATTLSDGCYRGMFRGCTSLTTAPELPATTLVYRCYQGMFGRCTSLTTAPELPATTLVDYCYNGMFSGCTNLNSITCLATNISATGCTTNWVSGVAASGTFNKEASMTGWTIGANGIPTNWTIKDYTAPTLEIWVDDFPYFNEISDFVDDPEGMGSNKYFNYGTITRNNITYYTWANIDALGTNYNYLITTTNDYNTLYQDSLEYNLGSTFSTFVERANSDFTQNYNSYDGNDMYLVKVEYDQNHDLVLWVDDWAYGPKLMEEEIADPDSYAVCHYTHNGETFVYNGTTYYLWEMVNDNNWNSNVAYLLTSTNSLSALRQESLENGYSNTFDSFVTYLTEDLEEYQASDEQYLVKITSNSNATLRVWVDDYPIDQDGELDGEPVEDVIQHDLNTLNANGNAYEYRGDTISYNGDTYYLWERNNNIGSNDNGQVPYLATSSVDYSTLQSQSLEDDYENHFMCALGFLTEDTDELYLEQEIGANGENGEYDRISLVKVEEIT